MRETVFLLEADIGVCQLAKSCLEEAGFSVRTVSAASVIEEAQDNRPSAGAGRRRFFRTATD